mgnify:CR=1 FL=1
MRPSANKCAGICAIASRESRPSSTPDEGAVGVAGVIRGALRLENERVLTFEIHEGASGAFFEDESALLHGLDDLRRRL